MYRHTNIGVKPKAHSPKASRAYGRVREDLYRHTSIGVMPKVHAPKASRAYGRVREDLYRHTNIGVNPKAHAPKASRAYGRVREDLYRHTNIGVNPQTIHQTAFLCFRETSLLSGSFRSLHMIQEILHHSRMNRCQHQAVQARLANALR